MKTILASVGHIKYSSLRLEKNKRSKLEADRILKKHFFDCVKNIKRPEVRSNIMNRYKKDWNSVYLPVSLECIYEECENHQHKEYAKFILSGKPWASFEIPIYEWNIMENDYKILLDRNLN